MSEFQRRGKKRKDAKKAQEAKASDQKDDQKDSVSLDDVFDEPKEEKPVEAKKPEPSRPQAAKPKATQKSSGVTVDTDKLLRFIARIKTGGYGLYGNGANFGNHMVKDCFRVDGKDLSLEEASALVRPFTSVSG